MKTMKAGTILVNLESKKIGLVKRESYYSFPKGHLEENETIIECAIRETEEETNRSCLIENKNDFKTLNYTTPREEDVICYYYVAIDQGETSKEIKDEDKEELVWVLYDEVEDTLSYDNLKELWCEAKHIIEMKFDKYEKENNK